MARDSKVWLGRQGEGRHGLAGHGRVRQAWIDRARCGMAGQARLVEIRRGKVWQGEAGADGPGKFRRGRAGQARHRLVS